MVPYLIKASLFLAFSHLFFRLVFHSRVNFRLSRIFLLSALLLAMVLPLVSFRITNVLNLSVSRIMLEPVGVKVSKIPAGQYGSLSLVKILSIIYIIGASLLLLRFFLKLFQLWLLYSRNEKQFLSGLTLVKLKKDLSPFTFFNILFFPENILEDKNADALKLHEWVHAKELHTLDLILYELGTILLWFHPSVWFMKKQCALNHEYLADASVMGKGYSMSDYRLALIDASMRFNGVVLGNSFNQSEIIKRLKMLLPENYQSKRKRKYNVIFMFSFIAVMAGLVFFVNACDNTINSGPDLAKSKNNEQVMYKVDTMPTLNGQKLDPAVKDYISTNLKYPEIAIQNKVSGKVYTQFVIDPEGNVKDVKVLRNDASSAVEGLSDLSLQEARQALAQESLRVVSSIRGFTPGIQDGKRVSLQFVIPITFKLN